MSGQYGGKSSNSTFCCRVDMCSVNRSDMSRTMGQKYWQNVETLLPFNFEDRNRSLPVP